MSSSAIPPPATLEIAPRIYVYSDGFFNAGYVLTDEGVLVIDSLLSPGYSRGLLESIKKNTSLPIRYLFYTHYHLDHTGGSLVLQQAGATIVANKQTAHLMRTRDARMRQFMASRGYSLGGIQPVHPSILFHNEMEIRLGARTFRLLHWGPTETDDAGMVYLPEEGVLFAGDTVFLVPEFFPIFGMPNMPEGLDEQGAWTQALERILTLNPRIIVPGHGKPTDSRAVQLMIDIQKWTLRFVGERVDRSEPVESIRTAAHNELPREFRLPEVWGSVDAAIYRAYRSLTGWYSLRSSAVQRVSGQEARLTVGEVWDKPRELLARIEIQIERGNISLALALADRALELNSENPEARALKARALLDGAEKTMSFFDKGDYLSEAQQLLEKAGKIVEQDPRVMLELGRLRLFQSLVTKTDPSQAISLLEKSSGLGLSEKDQKRVGAILGVVRQFAPKAPTLKDKKHCHNCGVELNVAAKFCFKCGEKQLM